MADQLVKQKRLGFIGLWKEVFNWYPAEYPAAERKCVDVCSCLCVPR